MDMNKKNIILLNGEWEVSGESPSGEELTLLGSVPGCALNDILNSGIEKEYNDIFYRDNAEQFQKYEDYSWHYKKSFVLEETDGNVELVFERLDTYCDIYLNGNHISYCDNGNIEHIFEVSKELCVGENILEVYFYSPIQMNRGRRKRRFCAFSENRLYTRRMQCTYGWDWTMRFVTCGIGNAYLRILDKGIKTESVYVSPVKEALEICRKNGCCRMEKDIW
jgi:beta-mannosidase